jgi:hypothetical protein
VEGLDICCDNLLKTFNFLADLDVSFSSWYRTSKPRKGKVAAQISLERNELRALLTQGQVSNDLGDLMTDIGYSLYLKSDRDLGSCSFYSL